MKFLRKPAEIVVPPDMKSDDAKYIRLVNILLNPASMVLPLTGLLLIVFKNVNNLVALGRFHVVVDKLIRDYYNVY